MIPNCIIIVDDSSVANLQSSLDRIHRWPNHWQLKLSPTKCTVMRLCKPSDNSLVDVNYSLCSSILPTVSSVTDLGVSYDSHLSFRPHINKIVSKASQRAKLILKCFVSHDRPILEFSSVIWNPGFKVDIDTIESVQKRFTKGLSATLSIC